MAVPASLIGWILMPIGVAATVWILLKKVHAVSLSSYICLAVIWIIIAVIFDYFFLVKLFKPADGYYKPDVYLYYALTFILPMLLGWKKIRTRNK